MPITAITAPTPMIMPSMVRLERILLRCSARRASRNAADSSITNRQSSIVGIVFNTSLAICGDATMSSRLI
jgi:hypothetical protein